MNGDESSLEFILILSISFNFSFKYLLISITFVNVSSFVSNARRSAFANDAIKAGEGVPALYIV